MGSPPVRFLVLTVLADVAGVLMLGRAGGFERPLLLAGGVAALVAGFVAFSFATREISPAIANAVWAGSSIVLVLLWGRLFGGERLSLPQLGWAAVVIVGTVGLSLSAGRA